MRFMSMVWGYGMTDKKNFCKNPIITSIYTADPAPMVYGDTLYLYTSHDEDQLVNEYCTTKTVPLIPLQNAMVFTKFKKG